jgi:hypothetical protein
MFTVGWSKLKGKSQMPRILLCLAVSVGLIGSAVMADAQPRRSQHVVVRLPTAILSYEGVLTSGGAIYAVDAEKVDGTLFIGQSAEWAYAGFPSMLHMRVHKEARRKDFTEIEFRRIDPKATSIGAIKVRVKHGTPIGEVYEAVCQSGDPSDDSARAYLSETLRRISDATFTGPLAGLSEDQRATILLYAQVTAGGIAISSETFRGQTYVAVDLGTDSSTYNDLRFTQSSLVAHLFNERLLRLLKGFAGTVRGVDGLYGLKLALKIPHRDFSTTGRAATYDLEVYSPVDAITAFDEAEITNQKLIDESVVILDTNRIEVPLSAAAP